MEMKYLCHWLDQIFQVLWIYTMQGQKIIKFLFLSSVEICAVSIPVTKTTLDKVVPRSLLKIDSDNWD